MVKADPKRNYYADLEIPLNATNDDIRKQFHKLARLYHPDRNQGKEEEFVPKFQAIQAAHEILADPNERAKYDAERKKLGYLAKPVRPPFATAHTANARTAPGSTGFFARQQYPQKQNHTPSNHAPKPPPRPQPPSQAPPTQRKPARPSPTWHRPENPPPTSPYTASYAHPSPATPGASRFTNFHPPPSARTSTHQDEHHARANAYSAWQSLNRGTRTNPGTGQNSPAASTHASEDERRANNEGPFGRPSGVSPGVRRSNTTKATKKAGFDPNLPGDFWEPPATRTSSYTTRHSFAAPGGQTPADSDHASSSAKDDSESSSHTPNKRHSHHDLRPSASAPEQPLYGERHSTPYRASGGEKLHLNDEDIRRSASTRDTTRLGARFETPGSSPHSRGTTPRSQSVNPKTSGSSRRQSQQAHVIDLTDSSDAQPSTRPMAKPSRRLKSPTKADSQPSLAEARKHNSDPERRPSIDTKFSGSETFQGFQGSNGLEQPSMSRPNRRSRMSPTRKAQGQTDPLQNHDQFKSIFPQLPAFEKVNSREGASNGTAKFDGDDWTSRFREPKLFMPDQVPISANGRTQTSTSRKQSRPPPPINTNEQTSSGATNGPTTVDGRPHTEESTNTVPEHDVDAMDIDLELGTSPIETHAAGKTARNVSMPLHRTNWHVNGETSSNPSTVHISPAPFPSVPTAVPNAMPPPPPPPGGPPPNRSPLSPRSVKQGPLAPSPTTTSPSLNLADLGQNLTSRGVGGVTDLGDLSSSLPFDSRASDTNPKAPALGTLNIPRAPAGPHAPTSKRLTQRQWKEYVAEMSRYMGEWYQWDSRILDHLQARHNESAKFGTGLPDSEATKRLEASGDPKSGGIERWEAELEQDRRIRDFWSAACNKHQKWVREYVAVKRRVAIDSLLP